jgi:hypothetical protein
MIPGTHARESFSLNSTNLGGKKESKDEKMTFSSNSSDNLMGIYLALGQYPLLRNRVRLRMQTRLFESGVITPQDFESEVRGKALLSKEREGINDSDLESQENWDIRQQIIREQLIDLYYSQHFSFPEFERLLDEVLGERGISAKDLRISLNPEMAPLELVFEQAMTIVRLPKAERAQYEARLQDIKVVLIRTLISDQLRYINIAKEWFSIEDLAEIRRRKIGSGKIGGKAAGMLLAIRILERMADPTLRNCIRYPESYYVGSDELYTFMSVNNLTHWNDQKYKSEEQMRADFPEILRAFTAGEFPPDILEKFLALLLNVGNQPLIVRSSSLLEDNFGMSFAGKYESIFLPNQGTVEENLYALTQGIIRIYCSALHPRGLLYRRQKGLQNYDERMAVLIQVVEGETFEKYYLPHAAGVAFSRNQYRWAPQIRFEDGFVRLVWGLGTRAVDRLGNEFPRLVALSHPLLRPSNDPGAIRRYSQQCIDLIDLKENVLKTLPIHEVLSSKYPPLRYLAQYDEEDYFTTLRSGVLEGDPKRLVLTFDELLRRTPFAIRMHDILRILEEVYNSPVDMEFTLRLESLTTGKPELRISILQCRPQSHLMATELTEIPANLPSEKIVLSTSFVVPRGRVDHIEYVVFVPHEKYYALKESSQRSELARAIGSLNKKLEGRCFVCAGPGRWGSSNSDLGVPVEYGDVYNTRALIEIAGQEIGPAPEPSLGTHFFQDLMEAQIYPLAIYLGQPGSVINRDFFYEMPNHLLDFVNVEEPIAGCLRLIKVSDYLPEHSLTLVMNDEKVQAVAFMELNK